MPVNKVNYGNQTIIDLTDSTLSDASQLVSGITAYDRSGTKITGTYEGSEWTSGIYMDEDGCIHISPDAGAGGVLFEKGCLILSPNTYGGSEWTSGIYMDKGGYIHVSPESGAGGVYYEDGYLHFEEDGRPDIPNGDELEYGSQTEDTYLWERGSWKFKLDGTGDLVDPSQGLVGEFVPSDDETTYNWRLVIIKDVFNNNASYASPYTLRFRISGVFCRVYRESSRTISTQFNNPSAGTSINSNTGSNSGSHYYFMIKSDTRPDPAFVVGLTGDPGYGSVGFSLG